MADATTNPGAGQQDPADSVGRFNPIQFAILQTLFSQVSTVKIVKVMAVDTGAKTVDVQIAVNQLDGNNNATAHGTINAIPYVWIMGGTNAFEIDPAVGDMGVMLVCDRDISAVRSSQAIANPGSLRKFDVADGIYLFGVPSLNGTAPKQWFKWTSGGGFNITDSLGNVQQGTADGIVINGVTFARSGQVTGNVTFAGTVHGTDFQIGSGGTLISLSGHQHSANNTPPTPGH